MGTVCKKLGSWLSETKRVEEARDFMARAGKILKTKKLVPKKNAPHLTLDSASEREANISGGNSEVIKAGEASSSTSNGSPGKGEKRVLAKPGKKAKRLIIRKV